MYCVPHQREKEECTWPPHISLGKGMLRQRRPSSVGARCGDYGVWCASVAWPGNSGFLSFFCRLVGPPCKECRQKHLKSHPNEWNEQLWPGNFDYLLSTHEPTLQCSPAMQHQHQQQQQQFKGSQIHLFLLTRLRAGRLCAERFERPTWRFMSFSPIFKFWFFASAKGRSVVALERFMKSLVGARGDSSRFELLHLDEHQKTGNESFGKWCWNSFSRLLLASEICLTSKELNR